MTFRAERAHRGFTLMAVALAMTVVAALAILISRDNLFNARTGVQQGYSDYARYLAEAGLQAVNHAVQTAGCTGGYPTSAAPLTNSNFEGGTYSAYSTNSTVPGPGLPVTLISTGTYKGSQVTLTRAAYVYKPRKTSTLQPGSGSGNDSSVNPNFPTRNYGADTVLRLYSGNYQPLIKFDLSVFPPGTRVVQWYDTSTATLKGATLSLYQSQSGTAAPAGTMINAYAITRSWVPTAVSWNMADTVNAWPSPGMGYNTMAIASTPFPNSVTWVDWDVTNAVAGWFSGVYPNYGLWLVESGGAVGDAWYNSSENATATLRPKLSISNVQPCGTVESGAAEIIADANIRADVEANYGVSTLMDLTSNPGRRILLKFNISALPVGQTIKVATLRIYCRNTLSPTTAKKSLAAWYVLDPWVEGTSNGAGLTGATWRTRNGTTRWTNNTDGGYVYASWSVQGRDEATNAQPAASFRQGWITFDVTAAVQSWVDGTGANNGLLLISSVADVMQFDSRETASGPELVVSY